MQLKLEELLAAVAVDDAEGVQVRALTYVRTVPLIAWQPLHGW